jgi:sulfonate transport system ATP-binding protein
MNSLALLDQSAPWQDDVQDSTVSTAPEIGLPVNIAGVSKSFGNRSVLHDIELHIPSGQFVAVVGRSGCGKTTLLRLVAGLDQVSGGHILLGNKLVSGLQGEVRMLFQDARLLQWQSVLSNVGIARGAAWRERALRALADVSLADRAEDWPSVLSGGQKQRVALARALVSRPNVLLLDEPFGALDALTRLEMHELLTRIWYENGFTTVLITHDVGEAVALADRVIVLRDGSIALDLAVNIPRNARGVGNAAIGRLHAVIHQHI